MKIAERIVMVLILLCLIGGGVWIYTAVKEEQKSVREAVARGEYEKTIAVKEEVSPEDWRSIYPNTVKISIAENVFEASVADTLPERMEGLSNTPFLPDGVVKLFSFGIAGAHSIWMKDMNYPIDILWLSQDGEIVHIEENVFPETYPEAFSSPVPAWYVIEANAGFTASNTIAIGSKVLLAN